MLQDSIQSIPRGSVNSTFHCMDTLTAGEISEWICHLQDRISPGIKPKDQNKTNLYASEPVRRSP